MDHTGAPGAAPESLSGRIRRAFVEANPGGGRRGPPWHCGAYAATLSGHLLAPLGWRSFCTRSREQWRDRRSDQEVL